MDQFRLDGKIAVITGSGQGIGRGIAWGLADAGCDVVLNARRANDLEETARGVTERGQEALVFASDIRDKSEELADLTMEKFGKVDIWVNNVGGSDEKNTRTLIDTPHIRTLHTRITILNTDLANRITFRITHAN